MLRACVFIQELVCYTTSDRCGCGGQPGKPQLGAAFCSAGPLPAQLGEQFLVSGTPAGGRNGRGSAWRGQQRWPGLTWQLPQISA